MSSYKRDVVRDSWEKFTEKLDKKSACYKKPHVDADETMRWVMEHKCCGSMRDIDMLGLCFQSHVGFLVTTFITQYRDSELLSKLFPKANEKKSWRKSFTAH